MTQMREIIRIQVKNDRCIRPVFCEGLRDAGSLASRCLSLRGCQSEILIDSVTRSLFDTGIDRGAVSIARRSFDGPLVYSGGISCLSDVDWLMGSGVDRVSICSSLLKPSLVNAIVDKYGSQIIIGTFAVRFSARANSVTFWKNMARDQLLTELEHMGSIIETVGEVNIFMIESDGIPLLWSHASRTIERFKAIAPGSESKILLQGLREESFSELAVRHGAKGVILYE